jgi:hypothetical protein
MRRLLLCALLSAGPLWAQPAAPSLQQLVANSPFGTAASAGVSGLPSGPLEFRGTFVDSGERFFSILDPATRRSEWVGLNEAGRPFIVKSYDAEREVVLVEFQGRTHDLKLHAARISALPPMPAAPVAAQAAMPGNARPAVAPSPSTTEAQRLAQVAEEIRRRRALRQAAQQGANPGQNPPPSQPQPNPNP